MAVEFCVESHGTGYPRAGVGCRGETKWGRRIFAPISACHYFPRPVVELLGRRLFAEDGDVHSRTRGDCRLGPTGLCCSASPQRTVSLVSEIDLMDIWSFFSQLTGRRRRCHNKLDVALAQRRHRLRDRSVKDSLGRCTGRCRLLYRSPRGVVVNVSDPADQLLSFTFQL